MTWQYVALIAIAAGVFCFKMWLGISRIEDWERNLEIIKQKQDAYTDALDALNKRIEKYTMQRLG